MPNNIPPAGNPPPASEPPSSSQPPPAPLVTGGAGNSMTNFMKLFTPEQRKKFMNILVQNLVQAINKDSQKAVAELRKEREDIEKGS